MSNKTRQKRIAAGRKAAEQAQTTVKPTAESKPAILTVPRKDAVHLLTALGFHAAHKASNAVLTLRFKKLPQLLEGFEGTLSGESRSLADAVVAAGPDGFEIVGAEPHGVEKAGEVQAPKVGKAGKKDKPAKQQKASGEKTKTKSKKRIDCLTDALKKLPKAGHTLENIAKIANDEYVKSGGEDNLKQTLHHLQVVLPVAVNLGYVSVNDGKLIPST
jgi:hypothetical protein